MRRKGKLTALFGNVDTGFPNFLETGGGGPSIAPWDGSSLGSAKKFFTAAGRAWALDAIARVCINTYMHPRLIIIALKADGWQQVVQKGSHEQFKHPIKPGRVTVPHPNKDIPLGTLRSIEKQSGLKLR